MKSLRHEHDKRLRWWPRRPAHIGRRGAMLLLLGVLYVVIGSGVFSEPVIDEGRYLLLHQYLPDWLRFGLWATTGLIAVAFAFRPLGRSDAPAWLALYLMPAERVISYIWAFADFYLPLGGPGYERGWVGAALYSIVLGVVVICAGWPEPPETKFEEMAEGEQPHSEGQ